jgi:hypothetical protein
MRYLLLVVGPCAGAMRAEGETPWVFRFRAAVLPAAAADRRGLALRSLRCCRAARGAAALAGDVRRCCPVSERAARRGMTVCAGDARAALEERGGTDMLEWPKRYRLQDLGLTGRDALLLLDALGRGAVADLDVAAAEMSPGTLAATVLFAVQTATGGLRPGMVGTMAEYKALAQRIAGMDPRDAFRIEGWVAGFRDAEDHGAAPELQQAALVGVGSGNYALTSGDCP